MKGLACLLAGVALYGVAFAEEDILGKMINKDTNGSWFSQPEKPKAKHLKADVLGGYAFRFKATKGANPWDLQANSPIAGVGSPIGYATTPSRRSRRAGRYRSCT